MTINITLPVKHLTKTAIVFLAIFILVVFTSNCLAQHTNLIYKTVDTVSLSMIVISNPPNQNSKSNPAMVFFHGGGWEGGSLQQLEPQARYFATQGYVSFLVEYRTKNRHQTKPFESLKDAKSAMRFVRDNAEKFNIDKNNIIAVGASAGGHLAAACALIPNYYNESSDDTTISPIPDALVLFNPSLDIGPGTKGYEKIGGAYKNFSPLHNVKSGAPPTIIFHGTEDKIVPVETVKYFTFLMERVDSRCQLVLFEGQGHRFFNYGLNKEIYSKILQDTKNFLEEIRKGAP